jgi:hypothetical protein
MVVLMELKGTPRDPAFSQSTSTRYCGTSSIPLGRTFLSRGSLAAMPRSMLRASISFSWPSPPRSSSWKSKPRALPSSMTGGGGKANTIASRNCEKTRMDRPARASTFRSFRSRRSQSLSRTNAIPMFCPRPAKLIPATFRTDSTASGSFVSRWSRIRVMTPSVTSIGVFAGSIAWTIIDPWSSSGR